MHDAAIERCLALSQQARTEQGEALAQTLASLDAALAQARGVLGDAASAAAADAELELDPAGYLTGWSVGAQHMFGYAAEEALGQHILFLYAEDDEDGNIAELFFEHDAAALGSMTEVRRRKKSGEMIWVRLSLSLRLDEGSEPIGMLVRLNHV